MVSPGLILFEVLMSQAVGCLVTVQLKWLRRWGDSGQASGCLCKSGR